MSDLLSMEDYIDLWFNFSNFEFVSVQNIALMYWFVYYHCVTVYGVTRAIYKGFETGLLNTI